LAGGVAILLNWLGYPFENFFYPIFALPAARLAGFFFNTVPIFDDQGLIVIPLAASLIQVTPDCSAQWKALQINEKKRLKTANAFEFEEEFKTPAPSFWLLLVMFVIFAVIKKIKTFPRVKQRLLKWNCKT
jgi:hypothetical protein